MRYSELSKDPFSDGLDDGAEWLRAGFGDAVEEPLPVPPVFGEVCLVALAGAGLPAGVVELTGAARDVLCVGCAVGETTVGTTLGVGEASVAACVALGAGVGRATIAVGTAPALGGPPLSPAGIAGRDDGASVAVALI
jgi:hypothetical protein